MTADKLIRAIRAATDLQELKQAVGPSDEENEKARLRLERMEKLWKHPGDEEKPEYIRLMEEQDAFEADYA